MYFNYDLENFFKWKRAVLGGLLYFKNVQSKSFLEIIIICFICEMNHILNIININAFLLVYIIYATYSNYSIYLL